ncbi:hypothetical protein, partial [Proteus faecis]|uniref:hypothetical protein n=1 Tax=Proteus faecis TaxID=2050967 RepID=UPI003075CC10
MQVLDYLKNCNDGEFVLFVTNVLKSAFWKNINNYKIPHPYLHIEAKSIYAEFVFDLMPADEFFYQVMMSDLDSNSTEAQHTKDEIKEAIHVVLSPYESLQ